MILNLKKSGRTCPFRSGTAPCPTDLLARNVQAGPFRSVSIVVKSKRTLFFKAQAPEIVRAAAVWALGKIGGEQSIRIIREMNQEKAPTVKTAVDLVLSRESAG